MTTAAQALATLRRVLPRATEAELQFVAAVTKFESHWGDAWDGDGAGSNNWGAQQEPHPDLNPSFVHVDKHEDGTEYVGHFKIFDKPEKGALSAALNILKPNVVEALRTGDAARAIAGMRANDYFEAPLKLYTAKISENYADVVSQAKARRLLSFDGPRQGVLASSGLTVFGFIASAVAAAVAVRTVGEVIAKRRVV